jgi:hypothetical protein
MKSHQKGFLKLKCFFSSQNIDFPFYLKRILELVFFHLSLLYIYIYAPSLDDSGGLMIFEEKITSSKTSFPWNGMVMTMDIPAVDAYSGMELCTLIWLNHDYGDGGIVDISEVDAYSGVDVCTTIFLGEAST